MRRALVRDRTADADERASGEGRGAVLCGAVQCGAVKYGTGQCCAAVQWLKE